MLGNDDNSTIEVNIDKSGNDTNVVSISLSEYKDVLECKYDLAIIKDVLFSTAGLSWDGKSIEFISFSSEVGKVVKYLFHDEYDERLAELKAEKGGE